MKILVPGHSYQLADFTNPNGVQVLHFIRKEVDPSPNAKLGDMVTAQDGTTNEEVLRVLINRLQFLHVRFACRENAIVITKLEESLMWLEKRTQDRQARGVEGKHLP